MTMKREFGAGERFNRQSLNAKLAEAGKLKVKGRRVKDRRGQAVISDEEMIYIKITAIGTSPKRYGWTEMYQNKDTGAWLESNRTGTIDNDPAFEINNTDVIVGSTIYRAERSRASGAWLFFSKSGQCPPSGIYSAYFFQLPSSFTFYFTAHHGVSPGQGGLPPAYVLMNKYQSSPPSPPLANCGLFDRHVTQVFNSDGSVYYEKEYDSVNPLLGQVIVPIPDNATIKYTVYTADGKILQNFSNFSYLFPGDTVQSPAQDIKYVNCPFTSFGAGLYGQIKYICNGIWTPSSIVQAASSVVWPAPSLVPLLVFPQTMTISASLRIGPRGSQSDADWDNANALLTNVNSLIGSAQITSSAYVKRGLREYYPVNGGLKTIGSFVVGGWTWTVDGNGQIGQGFAQTPIPNTHTPYDCDTSTISGYIDARANLRLVNSFVGPSGANGIGYLEKNNLGYIQSPPTLSYTEPAPPPSPTAAFVAYNTSFYLVNMTASWS